LRKKNPGANEAAVEEESPPVEWSGLELQRGLTSSKTNKMWIFIKKAGDSRLLLSAVGFIEGWVDENASRN